MFNPTLPADHSPLVSAEMRGQLNGLNDLIAALAAGTVTAVVVDAVNTVGPGQPANVTVSVIGNTLHLTVDIPQGADGAQGVPGIPGPPGDVNTAQLDAAIAGTSNNTNAVGELNTPFGDPDAEALRQKVNEMLLAMRR